MFEMGVLKIGSLKICTLQIRVSYADSWEIFVYEDSFKAI